jgi:hypothetical protein
MSGTVIAVGLGRGALAARLIAKEKVLDRKFTILKDNFPYQLI